MSTGQFLLTTILAGFCQLPPDKAKAAASVDMKRIMERQTIPILNRKGIYYLTEQTVFGEAEINRDKLLPGMV